MNDSLPTRTSVESIPLGSPILSLAGDDIVWNEHNRRERLSNAIASVIGETREIIPGSSILRLVVIPADFQAEVIRWQRELGQREGTTDGMYGVAHGKSMMWGDGGIESTYGIVILSADVVLSSVAEETLLPLLKGIFCHELAHLHEDFVYLQIHKQPHSDKCESWRELQSIMAYQAWSEFFADSIAYRYLKHWNLEDLVLGSISTLLEAKQSITQEIAEYRCGHNLDQLWVKAQEASGHGFSQLAKSAGLIIAGQSDDTDLSKALIEESSKLGVDWLQLIENILLEYGRLTSTPRAELDLCNLEALYERLMNLIGLYPKDQEQRIWIDVPI